jgi:hypothetical protein
MHLINYFAIAYGIYYTATGIWPLIDMSSFMDVTGPKQDLWLVRTVGSLVTIIGLTVLVGFRNINFYLVFLAVGSALSLVVIDLVYTSTGVISTIYLLDAFVQVLLIIGWIAGYMLLIKKTDEGQKHL